MGWRWAFYLVVPPGLILAALAAFQRDPRNAAQAAASAARKASIHDYLGLLRIPSYVMNTAAMTAMTFAIGGISFWIPGYIYEARGAEFMPPPMVPDSKLLAEINTNFGMITVAGGLLGTIFGGWLGDRLQRRFGGAYFLVSGIAILLAFPATVGMLIVPFPYAWGCIFLAVFFLFFNTGPANTALANVTPSAVRSTAFALNIFVIHAFGDAISPPLIGWIAGQTSMKTAFFVVSIVMVVASAFWLIGVRYLGRDTAAAGEHLISSP
jgi:predicted MFS family arabinose efflux permease